ncbi:GTP cyclohydrolase FolE2 [Oligoflexaceae bacterium]|nr:GTP cyclohydrolase FolE2 [Oligoflexaceae bacterium]
MPKDKSYPDVTQSQSAVFSRRLDKVGMSNIEIPLRLELPNQGAHLCPALADAYVSLDKENAKGIHMSRLFLALHDSFAEDVVSFEQIKLCLEKFLESHEGLSESAYLNLKFDLPVLRPSLLSGRKGWRQYKLELSGSIEKGECLFKQKIMVLYSSTCPCSAALSRQLIQQKFSDQHGDKTSLNVDEVVEWLGQEGSILATPHGQRSEAHITVVPTKIETAPSIVDLIDACESALSTPVQAAVKREDEQEFARLNGSNLMFAEDAGRRLAQALENLDGVADYRVEARHMESLHAHDAVSIVTKGLKHGLPADQSW